MKNYDNADLGIISLMLIAVACIVTGYIEQGIIPAVCAAIAGISRGNNTNEKP